MLKFSVLLSVYEKENPIYLSLALNSIMMQTLKPNEIVIVKDENLTVDLDRCIDEFQKQYPTIVKIVSFKINRGLGLALRDGVLECTNEYIARMDTDDIAVATRFEVQLKYLEKHPDISLLGSWIKEFSTDVNNCDSITQLPCSYKDIKKFAEKRNPFRHMTVIFKKSSVLSSGNYREFLWFEDYDLWVRMLLNGYKAENLPEFLVNVRATEDMFSRRGGWLYLKQEIKFQLNLLKIHFIDRKIFALNVFLRSFVRILPNNLRIVLYKEFLRKNGDNNAKSFSDYGCL